MEQFTAKLGQAVITTTGANQKTTSLIVCTATICWCVGVFCSTYAKGSIPFFKNY